MVLHPTSTPVFSEKAAEEFYLKPMSYLGELEYGMPNAPGCSSLAAGTELEKAQIKTL